MKKLLAALLVVGLFSWLISGSGDNEMMAAEKIEHPKFSVPTSKSVATFAGGCFWCVEAVFQETEGVTDVVSGYAGGQFPNPTYENVYRESTDHREAIQIAFDPEAISYEELLEILWRNVDAADAGGQFVDRGQSYTTAVFYHDDAQKAAAEKSIQALDESKVLTGPVVTPVLPHVSFYEAEEYHQDFYKKSSERYKQYESASGREQYKSLIWDAIQAEE